jgi:hypothetical protein
VLVEHPAALRRANFPENRFLLILIIVLERGRLPRKKFRDKEGAHWIHVWSKALAWYASTVLKCWSAKNIHREWFAQATDERQRCSTMRYESAVDAAKRVAPCGTKKILGRAEHRCDAENESEELCDTTLSGIFEERWSSFPEACRYRDLIPSSPVYSRL